MDAKPLALGWVLSVLLVGAVALWVGGRLAGESTVHAEPRAEQPATLSYLPAQGGPGAAPGVYIPEDMLSPLVKELRGIREELNALRLSSAEREPVTASGLDAGELERILTALDRRKAPTAAPASATSLFVPNPNANYGERLRNLHRRFELASESDETKVSREYFFKSEQEILDEFGLPAWMEADGSSLHWNYQFLDEQTKETYEVYVQFQNGRVIAVHW